MDSNIYGVMAKVAKVTLVHCRSTVKPVLSGMNVTSLSQISLNNYNTKP